MEQHHFDVALPVAIAKNFIYKYRGLIPKGSRVRVPFGSRRLIGMVIGQNEKDVGDIKLKDIEEVLDEEPIFDSKLLELSFWMSQYYLHPLGDVIKTMLPSSQSRKSTETFTFHKESEHIAPEWREALEALFPRKNTLNGATFRRKWKDLAPTIQENMPRIEILLKKGILTQEKEQKKEARKVPVKTAETEKTKTEAINLPPLTEEQKKALTTLQGNFQQAKTFLLHGVTGSGKTRVYISLIQSLFFREKEAQALVLVPEIALTPQMTKIFEDNFPGLVAVVHSAMTDHQRWTQLSLVRNGTARILIGARSAVFAAFQSLKLFIVDEEHDSSYKQSSGLTYNARDIAVVRAKKEKALCILGSATPSLESYSNVKEGKYELLELQHRVDHRKLPKVEIVKAPKSLHKEGLDHEVNTESFLDPKVIEALHENLKQGQQAMILVNRRGYAYYLMDLEEKEAIGCPQCSVSLSVHKNRTELLCHYCDYKTSIREVLSSGKKTQFASVGMGSQKAETILKELFPEAKVARLDSDVLSSRERLFEVLSNFRKGEIQILVGTQMIAKGHDFPNVALTVICEIDQLLDLPDFRAGERSFQTLVQAAGRAGRGAKEGSVYIQSSRRDHAILQYALAHDYKAFVNEELKLRESYAFPPFGHLIHIEFSSTSESLLKSFCSDCEAWQQSFLEKNRGILRDVKILGPMTPPLEKIKNRHRRSILLSSLSSKNVHSLAYSFLSHMPPRKGDLRIHVDVDPQSLI